MRQIVQTLPIFLLAAVIPAFAIQPVSQSHGSTHTIQVFQAGQGEPRVRDRATARPFSPRRSDPAQGMRRVRPYQAAKPGEGAPKA